MYSKLMINLGCEAEKIWTLVRHGTRYPSPESMLALANLENVSIWHIEGHIWGRETLTTDFSVNLWRVFYTSTLK